MTKKHTPSTTEKHIIPVLRFFFEICGRILNWFFMTALPTFSRYVWRKASDFSEFIVNWYESNQGQMPTQTREVAKYTISIIIFVIIFIVLMIIIF